MLAWNFTEHNICIVLNSKAYTVPRTSSNFNAIVDAIDRGDEVALHNLLDPKQSISTASEGRLEFDGHNLMFEGEVLHHSIVDRLHFLWANGLPYRPLLRFMDRLLMNPSHRAVNELYRFLENTDLPITNDGHFLAYKKVRSDFTDIYTGKFDNSVGAKPKVRRNEVDEDPNRTCSNGLHVCSRSYLPCFGFGTGNKVVVVKVDPADVVAVPIDYNNAKMRVCQYEVVRDITDEYENEHDPMPSYHTNEFDSEGGDDSFDDLEGVDDSFDDLEGEDDSFDDLKDETPVQRPKVSNSHVTSNKLNEHQVRDIKQLLQDRSYTLKAIADLYGVNESTIRKIRDGITWSWVK